MLHHVRARLLRFRKELLVVWYAMRGPGTPLRLRVAAFLVLVYLVSPLDLLPTVVPLIGIIDDLLIVPWGVGAIVSRLPQASRATAEARADAFVDSYVVRPLVVLGILLGCLLVVWCFVIWLAWRYLAT
jgi:uncharacterized membrane protein YkvA (DUF1232 family)